MRITTPSPTGLITTSCFLTMLICVGLVSAQQVTAQDPGWSPVIIATGEYRNQIKSMPIEQRPYRPLHFYGNSVRRNYYRGTPGGQLSEPQAVRTQSYRPSISVPNAPVFNAPVQSIQPLSWSANSYAPQPYSTVPRVTYPTNSYPTTPAPYQWAPYQYAPAQSWRGPAW